MTSKGSTSAAPGMPSCMLLLMFSLAGIPPTVGFYAKLSVLQAVVNAGYVWLAVVAVIFSLIGAFYYLRVVKLMYFDKPHDHTPIKPQGDIAHTDERQRAGHAGAGYFAATVDGDMRLRHR